MRGIGIRSCLRSTSSKTRNQHLLMNRLGASERADLILQCPLAQCQCRSPRFCFLVCFLVWGLSGSFAGWSRSRFLNWVGTYLKLFESTSWSHMGNETPESILTKWFHSWFISESVILYILLIPRQTRQHIHFREGASNQKDFLMFELSKPFTRLVSSVFL
jgi:hypothetical protein